MTTQNLTRLLYEQGFDSDLGPSSSSVSTATPPNGRNGRLLTPTSDDGEYVEYSFDSLSDMPHTVEDEDRVSHTSNSFTLWSHSCADIHTSFCSALGLVYSSTVGKYRIWIWVPGSLIKHKVLLWFFLTNLLLSDGSKLLRASPTDLLSSFQ